MSLRENLSINLRSLCREHGSVAAICREMGVNRQQFDRYLTMDALPNKATTERICRYFAIEEAELYRDPASAGHPRAVAKPPAKPPAASNEGPIAARIFSTPRPAIEPGFYQTFFALPGNRDELVCSITAIRVEEDRITFRRLTGLAETRGTTWSHFRGDHEGVVLERFNWFFFLGLNQRDPEGTDVPVGAMGAVLARNAAVRPRDDLRSIRAVDDDSHHAATAEGHEPAERSALGKGLRSLGSGRGPAARLQRQVHAYALSRARLFQRL